MYQHAQQPLNKVLVPWRFRVSASIDSGGMIGPVRLLPQPRQPLVMAEWKQSFEHGISDFRSGKYEEALAYFNEV